MTPERVRNIRQRLGLTQQGLAEELGMGAHGARTVRRWEKDGVRGLPAFALRAFVVLKGSG